MTKASAETLRFPFRVKRDLAAVRQMSFETSENRRDLARLLSTETLRFPFFHKLPFVGDRAGEFLDMDGASMMLLHSTVRRCPTMTDDIAQRCPTASDND